jgi:hypothetical protein
MKTAKLQTNLVGRKIHLLTDNEARIEASRQDKALNKDVLATITAEMMYPALKQPRKQFGDQMGEIVAVRAVGIGDRDYLVYTISFGGEIVELHPALWRLDPI